MGGGGPPLIPLYDQSPRPIPEPVGPANFRNDRTDHPVSPEPPVEAYVLALEEKRSPRPILKWIGPIIFFAEQQVGGGGWLIMMRGRGEPFPAWLAREPSVFQNNTLLTVKNEK
jgi:hypothetical protein